MTVTWNAKRISFFPLHKKITNIMVMFMVQSRGHDCDMECREDFILSSSWIASDNLHI